MYKMPESAVYELFPEYFGEAIGAKYKIVRPLGKGAMGEVLLVKNIENGKPYAAKFIDLRRRSEEEVVRAQAEIHCLLNCDFYSVTKCYEDFVAEEKKPLAIALILDYANAGDLRTEIKKRARAGLHFNEQEAFLLFVQILTGVQHIHSRKMIHRDIKTANVFLNRNGFVHLGDFGFSRACAQGDLSQTFCGTPYYVAPEIWKRRPYGRKADMFSLGVLFYEILTLRRPFDGNSMNEVMQKTLSGEYEPLPECIGNETRALVGSLLSLDPEKRPTADEVMCLPIVKFMLSGLIEIIKTDRRLDTDFTERALANLLESKQKSLLRMPSFGRADKSSSFVDAFGESETTRPAANDADVNACYVTSTCEQIKFDVATCTCIFEDQVKRQSTNGDVKVRYLGIYRTPCGANLLITAIRKNVIMEQFVVNNFDEIEDVIPTPSKFAPQRSETAFSIIMKNGKRLTFIARNNEQRDLWIESIQRAIGML
jgi:serine/threonine protein kinase